MNNCAIVIPIHREILDEDDLISLSQLDKKLKDYDKFVIMPESIFEGSWIESSIFGQDDYRFISFKNKYFRSVKSYNKLMLSYDFYNKFRSYKYILINQLDSIILNNNLNEWISYNYDYVGAPWILKTCNGYLHLGSGNGGLSLRKVDTFLEVLSSKNIFRKIDEFSSLPVFSGILNIFIIRFVFFLKRILNIYFPSKLFIKLFRMNEDIFWSYFATFFVDEYKTPDFKNSLKFSFEKHPRYCFDMNNNQLPLGVHAWKKYDPEFWREVCPDLFFINNTSRKTTNSCQ